MTDAYQAPADWHVPTGHDMFHPHAYKRLYGDPDPIDALVDAADEPGLVALNDDTDDDPEDDQEDTP